MNEQDAQVLAVAALFKHCLETMNSRVKKYGSPDDVFQTFREAAELSDTDVTQGIMTRFGDKVGRIRQGLRRYRSNDLSTPFTDESLKDSITDGINYLGILYVWVETGGGERFISFLEEAGMIPSRQPPLPTFTEPAAEEEGWFKKFISK